MSEWSNDMSAAPKGRMEKQQITIKGKVRTRQVFKPDFVWCAGTNGHVTASRWIPAVGRWLMFNKDTPPIAWRPYDFEEFLTFDDEGKPVRGRPQHPEQSS